MSKISKQQGFIGHTETLLVIIVLAVVGFGAWRITSKNNNESFASKNSSEAIEDLQGINIGDIKSIESIQSKAVSESDSSVIGVELDYDNGALIYIVHLENGKILAYNASNGDSVTLAANDHKNDNLTSESSTNISITKAIELAKTQNPNKKISKVKLVNENGITAYKIIFTDQSDAIINASNGTMLSDDHNENEAHDTETEHNDTIHTDETHDDDNHAIHEDHEETSTHHEDSHDH